MVVARVPSPEVSPIKAAIAQASQGAGESFDYLVRTATRESSLQSDAKAHGSSAAGLFQFIESTWLKMVRDHGAKYGLGQFAQAISGQADGRAKVEDASLRDKILDLRFDPKVSAQMAAELTAENRSALESQLGRKVSDGDLYLAHFLGASGAGRFLSERALKGDQTAANLFPDAAGANKSIFFEGTRPRSLNEVYDRLTKGFVDQPGQSAAAPVAASGETKSVSVEDFLAQLFRSTGLTPPHTALSPSLIATLAGVTPARALGALSWSSSEDRGSARGGFGL